MKHKLLLAVVLAIATVAPASAYVRTPYGGLATATTPAKSAAGMISDTGHILWGSGFTVRRTATGEYVVDFSRGYFKHCAAMVVGGLSGSRIVGTVTENVCLPQGYFSVDIYDATTHKPIDADFQFVATEVE